MERRTVRGVELVPAEDSSRRDDADGRFLFEHRADLHRRSVRAQMIPAMFCVGRQVHVESVLNVPGWMIGRGVERIETEPFGLNLGAVFDGETHATENIDGALEDLCQWMDVAESMAAPR